MFPSSYLFNRSDVNDASALQERVDAVEEILSAGGTQLRELLMRLRELIKGLPDLSRGLCRMQFGKVCSHSLESHLLD